MDEFVDLLSQLSYMPTIGVIVTCAIAVIALSVRDFHEPQTVAEIHYSVLRERYYFALAVHAVFALLIYLVLLYLLYKAGSVAIRETSAFTSLQRSLVAALSGNGTAAQTGDMKLQLLAQQAVVPIAAALALLVMVMVPRLPPFSMAADAIRRAMRELARYPQSAETMTAIIGCARLSPVASTRAAMLDDLARYGVSRREFNRGKGTISKIAAETLEETYALHLILAGMEEEARFRKFFLARRETAESLKLDHSALMRRAARAILAAEEVRRRGSDDLPDLILDISEFIAEEADILRTKHHRLLADACLSVLRTQAERQAFLSELGYDIALPTLLPLRPLVVVFALDLLIGLSPIVIARIFNVNAGATLTPLDTVIFSAAHAFALTAAMFLAIWPKVAYSAARPSLNRLPLPSYALFGAMSYLIGAALFYATFKTVFLGADLVAKHEPLAVSLSLALIFPVTTCGISILLDRRLREPSLDFWRNRTSDGIALGLALATTLTVFLAFYYWRENANHLGHPWIWAQLVFIAFYGLLGFAMGYLLPSAMESHIQAEQFIIESLEQSGKFLDTIDPRYGESVNERIPA